MLKQSSSRNHRGKRLRPKNRLQVVLLVAVSIWLTYQLTHSYSKRRAVAVETDSDGMDGELTQRRLGRKDPVDLAGDASGEDDVLGNGGGGSNARESTPDRLSKGRQGERGGSDEDDEESDEDDDDDDDGLPGDEEEDDKDFHPENGDGEDEPKTMRGKTRRASAFGNDDDGKRFYQPNELDGSVVPQVNATDGVQDGAAVPLVYGAVGGIDMIPELNSSRSLSKNSSTDVLLYGREATGNFAKHLLLNDVAFGVPGAEKPTYNASADDNRMANQYSTADSVKDRQRQSRRQDISS